MSDLSRRKKTHDLTPLILRLEPFAKKRLDERRKRLRERSDL